MRQAMHHCPLVVRSNNISILRRFQDTTVFAAYVTAYLTTCLSASLAYDMQYNNDVRFSIPV